MTKAVIIILVVLLLAGGGIFVWRAYINAPLSLDEGVTDPAIEALVANMRQIKDIRLDTSLFSDPVFRQLRAPRSVYPDTGTGTLIPPVANVGRENPFAPF